MEHLLRELVELHFRICFARVNTDALAEGTRTQLLLRHRTAAQWLLLGGTLMLPLLVLYGAAATALLTGQEELWGDTADRRMVEGTFGLFIVQFLLVAVVYILCLVEKGYKGRGFVLAFSELLHLSPRCLQNIWRVLAALPLIPLLGMLGYLLGTWLYEWYIGWYYLG